MTFLPVVARELRVASRRRATFWTRCVMAAAALIIGGFVYGETASGTTVVTARDIFYSIGVLAYIYCLAAGLRCTYDCLSEEKREGTMGFLFLTDLNGYDVVLGKLVATSLNAFYGLLAILPVMAVPLLMGGVTRGEFWRMALVLPNTFILSLAIGMFVSAVSKYPWRAWFATLALLLLFGIGWRTMLWWELFNDRTAWSLWYAREFCRMLDPGTALELISEADYTRAAPRFWTSVGITALLASLFLASACVVVQRSWQDRPSGIRAMRWREKRRKWGEGDAGVRAAFRRRLLGVNPYYWLAGRARLKPARVWLALAIVMCCWGWAVLENPGQFGIHLITALVLNTGLKFWIAAESGYRFAVDRKAGAMELILSTPLSVGEIVRGQLLALQRQFLAPVLVVTALEIGWLLTSLTFDRSDIDDIGVVASVWLVVIITLPGDALALAVVGMWGGLTVKNPNRAAAIPVMRILVLPVFLWSVIMMWIATAGGASGNFGYVSLGLWIGLGLITDLGFGLSAWDALHGRFRDQSVAGYSAPPARPPAK